MFSSIRASASAAEQTETPHLFTIEQCIEENIPLSAGYRDFEGYKGKYPDRSGQEMQSFASTLSSILRKGESTGYMELTLTLTFQCSVLNGDLRSETDLQEMMGRPIRLGARDIQMETQYEYGTRAGVWRIARLLEAKNIKATVYAVGQSILKAPDAAKYLAACGHEISSHGYRWIDYHPVPLAVEKEHIKKCISAIKTVSGKAPRGWYVGRPSLSSKGLVCHVFKEQGLELLYQCDSYADEMPYWTAHPIEAGKGLLTIPYTYDVNDNKFCTNPGFVNPKDWLDYCKAAFDVMYQEGCDGEPKMMTIGLHSRIIGKPARFMALRALLEYIQGHEGVWFATREEIARHWQATHPFDKSKLNRRAHFI